MARTFNGSTDGLSCSAPLTALPFSLVCWAKSSVTAGVQSLLRLTANVPDNSQAFCRLILYESKVQVQAQLTSASQSQLVASAGTYSTSGWFHAGGVFAGTASRAAYLNGSAGTTNTGTVNAMTMAQLRIGTGANQAPAPVEPFSGALAEAAVYKVALSAADMQALAAGASPLSVRPESLVWYCPLVRDVRDVASALTITVTGTSVSEHPRVYR